MQEDIRVVPFAFRDLPYFVDEGQRLDKPLERKIPKDLRIAQSPTTQVPEKLLGFIQR